MTKLFHKVLAILMAVSFIGFMSGAALAQTVPGNGTTTPTTTNPNSTSTPIIIIPGDQSSTTTPTTTTTTPGTTLGGNSTTTPPNTGNTNTSTTTETSTSTTTPNSTTTPVSTTTPPTTGQGDSGTTGNNNNPMIGTLFGWLVLPSNFASLFNTGSSSSTSSITMMTAQNPYNYVNGYPMWGSSYVDCNGNVDNDPGHHTTDPKDHDPAHHSGMNCPGGAPKNPVSSNNGQNGAMQGMASMFSLPNMNMNDMPWVVIPLTLTSIQNLLNMFK